MEWLFLLLAAGGSVAGWRRLSAVRADRQRRAAELETVRHLADEDVTAYGEQLQHLGDDLGERELDVQARRDYQHALDAYERAKWAAPRLGEADEISQLTDVLADGRYSVACVRARVAGEPPPERRLPCFFNPQHGPSWHDVMWTTGRHGSRRVPACQQCAARMAAREKPDVRMVQIGARRVPYWEAGASYLPYTRGYFPAGAGAGVAWLTAPDVMDPGGYGAGGHDPGASGFGVGGADFGGMDLGGGGDGGGGGH